MYIKGRLPAIATPLTPNEQVDEIRLRQLIDFLIERGAGGIWANGGFSGFAFLRDEEQLRAVEIIVDQVDRRVPVIAGITDSGVVRAIERGAQVASLGPDCLFLQSPSYGIWDNSQLLTFYREVSKNVDLPLFIYNDPWSTRIPVEMEVINALSRDPNVVGIKDSSENPYQYVALAQRYSGSDFTLLAGTMHLGYYTLSIGFDGVVDPTDNFYIELGASLCSAVEQRDWGTALELQRKVDRIGDLVMNLGDYRAAVEACMKILGLCEKITPRPFESIADDDVIAHLRDVLREVGLLGSAVPTA